MEATEPSTGRNRCFDDPLVALDLVWSIAVILVSCSVLLVTARERPSEPIRVWILGYALHCLVHVCFVCFEHGRRRPATRRGRDRWVEIEAQEEEEALEESRLNRFARSLMVMRFTGIRSLTDLAIRVMKKIESTNAVISFFWWMLGLYWIVLGGQTLLQDAPRLYWLTVVFLVFDVFFAIFCVILASIIGVALLCCLPCIFAVLYSFRGREGAAQADINALPRFAFRFCKPGQLSQEAGSSNPLDSDCCICLCRYEDGAELCSLPCGHQFHSGCIVKWLRINATCPLCKFNFLRIQDPV